MGFYKYTPSQLRSARPACPADLGDEEVLARLLALNLERAAHFPWTTTTRPRC